MPIDIINDIAMGFAIVSFSDTEWGTAAGNSVDVEVGVVVAVAVD
jgi:hypothetical protein